MFIVKFDMQKLRDGRVIMWDDFYWCYGS